MLAGFEMKEGPNSSGVQPPFQPAFAIKAGISCDSAENLGGLLAVGASLLALVVVQSGCYILRVLETQRWGTVERLGWSSPSQNHK